MPLGKKQDASGEKAKNDVTEEGARTLDHKVKSLALYQLSYSGPRLMMSSLGCPRMIRVQVTYANLYILTLYNA